MSIYKEVIFSLVTFWLVVFLWLIWVNIWRTRIHKPNQWSENGVFQKQLQHWLVIWFENCFDSVDRDCNNMRPIEKDVLTLVF